MTLYNANGQRQVTLVNGNTFTGIQGTDGTFNGVSTSAGGTPKGLYHPCGAYNVVITTDPFAPVQDSNGSYNVISNGVNYSLLRSGTFTSADTSWVLAGAVVDMDFQNNRFYPTALATLMDGTHTGALGALATAFNGTDISILLQLKVLGAAPTGTVWITCNSFNPVFSGLSDTTFRSRKTATSLPATLGSGAFSTNLCKIAFAADSTTGRTIVGNNGTPTTDAQTWTSGAPVFANVDSQWNRFTVWNTRLPDATLASFTV